MVVQSGTFILHKSPDPIFNVLEKIWPPNESASEASQSVSTCFAFQVLLDSMLTIVLPNKAEVDVRGGGGSCNPPAPKLS